MVFLTSSTDRCHTLITLFLIATMTVIIGTALDFQHVGSCMTSKLCLEQAHAYIIVGVH